MPEDQLEKRIEKELVGEPIQADEYTVRPVAHVRVSRGEGAGESYAMAGAYVRLAPTALLVEGPDGDIDRIIIDDPMDRAMDGLVRAGLLVAGISITMILARKLGQLIRA
jgi:uncharacterized spore protein YtfJ